MRKLGIRWKEAINALSEEFGKPVHEIGEFHQLDFHIDLSMAVARNHTTGKEIVYLGSSSKTEKFLKKWLADNPSHRERGAAREWLIHLAKSEHSPQRDYWNLKEKLRLEALGYEVRELLGFYDGDDLMFANTNAIFSGRHVILPKHRLGSVNEQVAEEFRSLGYTPIFFESAPIYFRLNGGPRCASCTFR